MHRQFITYQGKPLVVGEEDDLLTIPEPGIEVNEILGSAEVTEKIAEDVQVGDLIYKSVKYVDVYDGDPAYNAATCNSFVEHNGDLYASVMLNDGTPILYKYENERWRDLLEGPNRSFWHNDTETGKKNGGLFTCGDDLFLGCVDLSASPTGYFFRKFENGAWSSKYPISDEYHIDPSSAIPITYGFITEPLEASGKCHVILPQDRDPAGVENLFFPYTYDSKTNKLTKTSTDPSATNIGPGGRQVGSCRLVEYENSVYAFLHSTGQIDVFRYDPGDDHWYFVDDAEPFQNTRSLGFALSSTYGLFYLAFNLATPLLFKLDTSSNTMVQQTVSGVSSYLLNANYGGLWEEDGHIYIYANGRSTSINTSGGVYVAKYNPTTSSVTVIPDAMDLKGRTGQYIGDQYHPGSFITYNGEHFTSVNYGNTTAPHLKFYKWNSTLQKFEDVSYWGGLHGSQVRVTAEPQIHEYQGRYYYATEQYIEYLLFGEYVTSGNPSGYFVRHNLDTVFSRRSQFPAFYESDNELYCFVGINDTTTPAAIYKLDVSADFWNKLSQDCVSSVPNLVCQGGVDIVNFSGQNFLAMGHYGGDPSISTYIIDGSSMSALPDVSSFATIDLTGYYAPPRLVEYSNELFMFVTSYHGGSDLWDVYKWDGSYWQDVNVTNMSIGDRGTVHPYVLSGNLYALGADYDSGECELWVYDGSSFNKDLTEYVPEVRASQFSTKPIVKDGKVYLSFTGYQTVADVEGLVRDTTGEWIPFGWRQGLFQQCQWHGMFDISATGEVFVLSTIYSGKNGMYKSVISEFFNESVWFKNPLRPLESKRGFEEVGIALESGSKGDTIRIQKVRR